eukprot:TRINITY_DN47070_c0_g1_i1.p1 TRINITY_DN47070_c0_g1~~TRINITY_DN47070_c0_g1_i1.p1  ORF type:complete len:299 (-),score=48.35 TRINITY_DN47070_c0_g1_i1:73-969(-)
MDEDAELRLEQGSEPLSLQPCDANGPSILGKTAVENDFIEAIEKSQQYSKCLRCPSDIKPGDVVLVEVDPRCFSDASESWLAAFSLVTPVKDSLVRSRDLNRSIFTCVGVVTVILLSGTQLIPFHIAAGVLLLSLMLAGVLTLEDAYKAVNMRLLLVIVGGSGLAAALEETGIAAAIARHIMAVAPMGGRIAVYVAIYFLSAFLSMWINNTAVVAILAPMLPEMQKEIPDEPIGAMVLLMLAGASSCFTTPFGYQTNMMVMGVGQYAIKDFMRFGFPVQVIHGATAVLVIPWYVHTWH